MEAAEATVAAAMDYFDGDSDNNDCSEDSNGNNGNVDGDSGNADSGNNNCAESIMLSAGGAENYMTLSAYAEIIILSALSLKP